MIDDASGMKAKLLEWKHEPVKYAWEAFGIELDNWQAQAIQHLVGDGVKRIALKSSAGPGKSLCLSIAGWYFLQCANAGDWYEHPKGQAISITNDNLKTNLWAELSKLQQRNPWLKKRFKWSAERIVCLESPATWFMAAKSWAKKSSPDEQGRTLSGHHAKYVLNLIDESGDIPPAVGRSAEQSLTGCRWGRIFQAGNTTSHEGMLYEACTKLRHLWEVISVTGDPDNPNRSKRIDIEWARSQIELYGRDNPWVMAYVLGEFPSTGLNTLLSPEDVEESMNRYVKLEDYQWSQKRLGCDTARFGDDITVIFPRQGLVAFRPVEMRNARTDEIAARIAKAKADWGSDAEFIDDTGGYGAGVIDNLLTGGYSPISVQFAGKPSDMKYRNKRSEMWMLMAEWVKRGGALPKIPELVRELTTPTYTFIGGKIALEEKDQIKKRLGSSPDRADALATTFFYPDQPGTLGILDKDYNRGKLAHEWDPYEERT